MNAEELDDALCIVGTQRPTPGAWIPEQVACRDIKAAFACLVNENAVLSAARWAETIEGTDDPAPDHNISLFRSEWFQVAKLDGLDDYRFMAALEGGERTAWRMPDGRDVTFKMGDLVELHALLGRVVGGEAGEPYTPNLGPQQDTSGEPSSRTMKPREGDKIQACVSAFVAAARYDNYSPSYLCGVPWLALQEIADADENSEPHDDPGVTISNE